MSNSKVSAGPVETLRAAISGDVFVPGDDGYDEARRAWNLTEDQRPAVVVVPESAAEVARAVRFARAQGMRIAPQATGHGAAPLEPLEGAMLLKTSRLRRARRPTAPGTPHGRGRRRRARHRLPRRLPGKPQAHQPARGTDDRLVDRAPA